MRLPHSLWALLFTISSLASTTEALRNAPKVKLSNVKSLTLREGLKTSHRRVDPIPQLKCIGGSARPHYAVDVMRCKNSGSDYDEEAIQWTCTASLPEEFKLGSTDVICEGYDSPEDPFILKGSCGVEYRLVLTEKGMEKYGKGKGWFGGGGEEGDGGMGDREGKGSKTMGDRIVTAVFWMVFIGVALWIAYNAVLGWAGNAGAAGAGGNRPGWGGGGGGGGGYGGPDDSNDPPPPYDWRPGSNNPKQSYGGTQNWRPGFWSGALGGAAAGYAASNWGNRSSSSSRGTAWDRGEGSSRSSSGSSGSPSYSSTRHESTGFGSTSRR